MRWSAAQAGAGGAAPLDSGRPYGPACPQPIDPGGKPNGGGYIGPVSEYCLNLNVFAPHGARHAPVMVWIFGGGNVAGANAVPSNDGTNFARDGVVLVSINYRLGALGFLAHPALVHAAKSGEVADNFGVQDQIAALAWIHRNIKLFGGDPNDNVTIFGEVQLGGMNVLTLMAMPCGARPVPEGRRWSPGRRRGRRLSPWRTAEAPRRSARPGGSACRPTPAWISRAPCPWTSWSTQSGAFRHPVVDGRLIKEGYLTAFARGDEAPVPLIAGTNDFEGLPLPSDKRRRSLSARRRWPRCRAAYVGEAKGDAGAGPGSVHGQFRRRTGALDRRSGLGPRAGS